MGNLDIIIVLNALAYLIKGTDYTDTADAIQKAFEKRQKYIDSVRAEQVEARTKGFDDIVDEDWFPEDITSVQVLQLF